MLQFLLVLLGLRLSAWSAAAAGHEPALEVVRTLSIGTGNITWYGYRDATSAPTASEQGSCDHEETGRCTSDKSDAEHATAWGCWWLATNMESLKKEPVARGVRSICGSKDKHPDCCISWQGELQQHEVAKLHRGVQGILKECPFADDNDTDPLLAFDEPDLAVRGFAAHSKLDSSTCTRLCLSNKPEPCPGEPDVQYQVLAG